MRPKPGEVSPGQKISLVHFAPKHCGMCGGVLEKCFIEEDQMERLFCNQCNSIEYVNQKIVAGTIAHKDGKWLLIKRGINPQKGKWTFPAGFTELWETMPEAAIRETWEETGFNVEIEGIVGVYSYTITSVVVLVYWAKIVSGEAKLVRETEHIEMVDPEKIPWEDLAFWSTKDALQDALKEWKKK